MATTTSAEIAQINETGTRSNKERREAAAIAKQLKLAEPKERRSGKRRRQIDPTTCEREYTEEEVEFMRAMDEYKRSSGRMFPTCSEILEVLRGLGYGKVSA